MNKEVFDLWTHVTGECMRMPTITAYTPAEKKSDGAVVILPGGGYGGHSPSEGEAYAKFLNDYGITAFVCSYRVAPHKFPAELLDARRAMRFVRYNSEKYGLNKNKIYIMGSSAGGHLAALLSTYFNDMEIDEPDEIDEENFKPDGQILCYPVIALLGSGITHFGSGKELLGDKLAEMGEALSPNLIAGNLTPQAFIWHTFEDSCVNVINSLEYAKRMKKINVPVEMHIFPKGEHGLGLAEDIPHVAQWKRLLLNWLEYNNFFN